MLFISAVPDSHSHRFIPCSAKNIAIAKDMAIKLAEGNQLKLAVSIGDYGQSHFLPVVELRPGCDSTWQSLCPLPLHVSLSPTSWGMGGVPPMVTAASALAPAVARGESFANPCAPFAS